MHGAFAECIAPAALDPTVEQPDEEAFDAFIDASGVQAAIDGGLRALRAGGTAVMVGMASERVDLDLFLLQSRELHLEGLFGDQLVRHGRAPSQPTCGQGTVRRTVAGPLTRSGAQPGSSTEALAPAGTSVMSTS